MPTTLDDSALPPAAGTDAPTRQPSEPVGARTVEGPIYRPDMLMIGSFVRNSGKTELACRIIRRLSDKAPVVGLKVTTVERTDGRCPHHDTGCGVCSSHVAPWAVSRELDRDSAKDTCRLLASGAHEVYWLRALRSELAGGAADLLSRVPAGRLSVCESNSLRTVVEPGLFLQVRSVDANHCKPSARAVAHLADRLVVSDGRSFDLDLGRISIVHGQWALRREACAVIVDGTGCGKRARRGALLQRTRTSLEPQFDRVEVGPAGGPSARVWRESVASAVDHEWCFVTPPMADGVPPAVIDAMFRRRAQADAVVSEFPTEGSDVKLVLCRRHLLPDVMPALGGGPGALAALGDRCAVQELRLRPAASSGGGLDLPPPPSSAGRVPASDPANPRDAEMP